jgi:uncharacterized membrane protein
MTDSFFKNNDDAKSSELTDLNGSEQERASNSGLERDRGVIAAILSYIPLLCLIPLIQMRDNEQARFHSKQGLVLFLIELVALLFLIPGLSSLIWKTILILALGASVAGIIFGLQGKKYKLPLIGDISEKINL